MAARRIFDNVVLQKMTNEEGDAVEYRRSKRESVITDCPKLKASKDYLN